MSSLTQLFGGGSAKPSRYDYIFASKTVTAAAAGTVVLRCMGAGGGGSRSDYANGARGGNGGTVATRTLTVAAGDQLVITIPAGGAGAAADNTPGSAGGTLTILRAGVTLISIPGGNGGPHGAAPVNNTAPTGADWYVLGGLGGNLQNSGGGGAMIVEGGTVAGTTTGRAGGGACGNGNGEYGGGALTHATSNKAGWGLLTLESSVLRIAAPLHVAPVWNGSTLQAGSNGHFGGGNGSNADGGFGGGGGSGGGARGFGGGGSGGGGGGGGQGWVTLEWVGA